MYGGWVPNPDQISKISAAFNIPASVATLVDRAAYRVDGNPMDLARVIWHESRFNPQAQFGYIKGPPGGKYLPGRAVGLIQFTEAAGKSVGATPKAIFGMTAEKQMAYVEKYLVMVTEGKIGNVVGPLDNQYKMALAVFYPGWRELPPESPLPERVAQANPGITTIGEYVNRVLSSSPVPDSTVATSGLGSSGPGAAIVIGAIGLGVLALVFWPED